MKNLSNNKIYKLGQLALFAISILSLLVMITRYFAPYLASKISFLSIYTSWTFWNIGLSSYQNTPTNSILIKLIISCIILYGISIVCCVFSRKSEWFMVGALGYIIIDTVIFTIEMVGQNRPKMLIAGLVVKILLIAILSISLHYGILGYSIENTEGNHSPAMKFLDPNYSEKLVNIKRKVTFVRSKSFLNSYIYLQIIIDGKTLCYLKDNETQIVEIDANQHILTVVPHFEKTKRVKVAIPSGQENQTIVASIKNKNVFSKEIIIYKK